MPPHTDERESPPRRAQPHEPDATRRSDPSARPLPTALAVLAFLPLAGLLWWAFAGPRPAPAELDWDQFGFTTVEEHAEPPAFPTVYDLEWVHAQMAGWQSELGGQLAQPKPIAPERFAAVVRTGDSSGVTPLDELTGVVEWSVGDTDVRRCAFPEPVNLEQVRALTENDGELDVEEGAVAGRCTADGPVVALPLTVRHVEPQGPIQRLLGGRAESALLPAGVAVVRPDGVTRHDELSSDLGLPVFPREVVREMNGQAVPDNPAADVGTWADPVYPLLVPWDGRLWWVQPVAPRDGARTTTGYLFVAADELAARRLHPVRVRWLAQPVDGPDDVVQRVERILDDLSGVDDADLAIRPTLPSAQGRWHGRVDAADERLRFLIDAERDDVCLTDGDGRPVRCYEEVASAGRSSVQ